MANTNNIIQAGVQIVTQVQGSEQIEKFIQNIHQASGETSKLSNEAKRLTEEWQQAQSNQELINHYQALNQKIGELPSRIQEAREESERLKQVWLANQGDDAAKMAYVRQAKEVNVLGQTLEAVRKRVSETQQAMQQAGIATQDLANQQKAFALQANQAKAKLSELNQKANELHQITQSKAVLGLDVDDAIHKEINDIKKAYNNLKDSGTLSHAELARAAELQRDKIYRLEKSLSDLRPTLRDVADEFQGMVSRAAGLTYLAKEAIEFESAMAKVKKVTDATPEQLQTLSNEIKKLAGELGILPDELAGIAAAGGQMGIAFDKLPEYTKITAQMAKAFDMTAEEAGDMSAKIANVFGLSIDEITELGDAINTLGNTTAAKEREIGNVLMRIGGNAKQFKLAKEEAAALAAAFVSLGKSPEEAGTAINALLSKLQTSTEQSSEFKNSLKDIGLSAQEMADNIAANPQNALNDFLQRIEKLDEKSRSIVLSKMFGAEYSDDLALLVGGLETYEKALENATNRTETFGAMQKEAGAALETTKGKMDIAKSQIANTAIELGNSLLPVVQASANAVGGVAQAVKSVSEEFPILSQFAVLFLGAKVGASALGAAMKLAGVEGAASILKADVGVNKLKASIVATAAAAKTLGSSIQVANVGGVKYITANTNALKDLSSKLGQAAQGFGALWMAGEAGYGVGKVLREQFTSLRDLGDYAAKGIAYLDDINPFIERSLADVKKHFQTTRELLAEQKRLEAAAKRAAMERAEAQKKASAEQAQYIEQLTTKYRQEQKQLNATDATLRQLENSGQANTEMYRRMTEQKKQLETQIGKTRAELTQFQAQIDDVSPLAKNRQALEDLGLTAEQMATGISKSAKSSLDNFKLAAKTFGNDAESMATLFQAAVSKMDTPEAMTALKQALMETGAKAGLTAEQINFIAASATTASLNLSAISKPLGAAQTAADSLGISLTSALSGSSPEFQAALMKFSAIRSQLDGLAEQGMNVGVVLQQSFAKLTENAQTQADIDALKNQIKSLGEAGKLSTLEWESALIAADVRMAEIAESTSPVAAAFKQLGVESRTTIELQYRQAELALQTIERSGQASTQALEQARNKVQELKNALDPTAAAFDRLGIKTKEALAQAAQQQMADFEKVKQSGQATQADLQRAFQQTAQAALASGDVSAKSWVQSNAAAYQYKVVVDASGKANLQAAAETTVAATQQIAAHQQVAAAATQAAQAQSIAATQTATETEKSTQAIASQGKALSELGKKVHYSLVKTGGYAKLGTAMWADSIRYWQNFHINVHKTISNLNQETERGGNIAEWLSKATLMASDNVKVLDKTTLNNLNAAIDKARQKMKQLAEEAANARLAAEKELLSAQGRDDEVRRLEQQEKLNELKAKQDAARKMGNSKASADYAAAIAAQQRAYAEQARREQQQREQERRDAEQQAREQAEQQRAALQNTPVRVETNVNDLADLISAQNTRVANAAVQQFEQQLRDALAMQR